MKVLNLKGNTIAKQAFVNQFKLLILTLTIVACHAGVNPYCVQYTTSGQSRVYCSTNDIALQHHLCLGCGNLCY